MPIVYVMLLNCAEAVTLPASDRVFIYVLVQDYVTAEELPGLLHYITTGVVYLAK